MRALATTLVLACLATPALATGEIVCSNGKGVSVDLLVGHVPFLSIARAVVSVGDKDWSSQPDLMPGTTIAVAHAFEDEGQMLVDIADDGMNEIIIKLRVFKAKDGDKSASGGVLSVKGEGAFVIDCSEPE